MSTKTVCDKCGDMLPFRGCCGSVAMLLTVHASAKANDEAHNRDFCSIACADAYIQALRKRMEAEDGRTTTQP